MSEFKPRPVIFLYTDAAEIADDVRERMVEAGYLPIHVADVSAVKIMTAPLAVEPTDVSAITIAALEAIVASDKSTTSWSSRFGARVAAELLASAIANNPPNSERDRSMNLSGNLLRPMARAMRHDRDAATVEDIRALRREIDDLEARVNDAQSIRRGCICPPGSNKDCEAPLCPRKPFPRI